MPGSFNSILTPNVPFCQEAKAPSEQVCVFFLPLVHGCNHGRLNGSIDIRKPFHFSTITTGNCDIAIRIEAFFVSNYHDAEQCMAWIMGKWTKLLPYGYWHSRKPENFVSLLINVDLGIHSPNLLYSLQ